MRTPVLEMHLTLVVKFRSLRISSIPSIYPLLAMATLIVPACPLFPYLRVLFIMLFFWFKLGSPFSVFGPTEL